MSVTIGHQNNPKSGQSAMYSSPGGGGGVSDAEGTELTIIVDTSSVANFNFSLSEAIILLEEHRSRDAVFDPATEGALISAYVVVMVTGVLSNLLMASVICSRKHMYRNRNGIREPSRRGTHFFLLNLNASDLALCMVAMPFTLLQLVRRHWGLGDAFCKGVALVQGASVFVSSSTISAIAVQRQRAIVRLGPHIHAPNGVCCCFDSANGAGQYPISCAMSIWLLSLVLAAPASMARTLAFAEVAGVHVYTRCVERWPSPVFQLSYALATFVFQLVTPTALLASTHIRVRGQLRYTLKGTNSGSTCPTHSTVCAERLRRELDRNRRATVVLLYVTAAFALTWLPWNLVNLIVDVSPSLMSPRSMYLSFAICHLIAMTSATINPVLYGWLNTNLRRQVRSLKKRVLRNMGHVQPEDGAPEIRVQMDEEEIQVIPCVTSSALAQPNAYSLH